MASPPAATWIESNIWAFSGDRQSTGLDVDCLQPVPFHMTPGMDIQAEAETLLRSGMLEILGGYGEVHVIGSYALQLMTWRDLDLHLVREDMDVRSFFDLGRELADLLKPHRMHFRDETVVATP